MHTRPMGIRSIWASVAAVAITGLLSSSVHAQQPASEAPPATASEPGKQDRSITLPLEEYTRLKKAIGEKPYYEMNLDQLLVREGNAEAAWDKYKFYQLRQVELHEYINDSSADRVIQEIRTLDTLKPGTPIRLNINSPGGLVDAGMRIYNAMQLSKSPIITQCDGNVSSMAAVLLISGDQREAFPACRVMVHEVSSGTTPSKTNDQVAQVQDSLAKEEVLFGIISKNTGLSTKSIAHIGRNDTAYSAQESLKLGFVDSVIPGKASRTIAPGSRAIPAGLTPEEKALNAIENKVRIEPGIK